MKKHLFPCLLLTWTFSLCLMGSLAASQNMLMVHQALLNTYGSSTTEALCLVKSQWSESEPLAWMAYARDPHRADEQVKITVSREPGQDVWTTKSAGSGQLLQKVPPVNLDLTKVAVGPVEARRIASNAAELAKMDFFQVQYQLATQPGDNAVEWALTLADAKGVEVGFVVISAETGAVLHQDFGIEPPPVVKEKSQEGTGVRLPVPEDDINAVGNVESGEDAARVVKKGVRKAWNWTERAGQETKGFFKELFHND